MPGSTLDECGNWCLGLLLPDVTCASSMPFISTPGEMVLFSERGRRENRKDEERRKEHPIGMPLSCLWAGVLGFEPRQRDPESRVLPLDDTPSSVQDCTVRVGNQSAQRKVYHAEPRDVKDWATVFQKERGLFCRRIICREKTLTLGLRWCYNLKLSKWAKIKLAHAPCRMWRWHFPGQPG